MKQAITKQGKLAGVWLSASIYEAIKNWIALDPERDQSVFLREAAREKLRREHIQFEEEVNHGT